jgi:hypothetical protein
VRVNPTGEISHTLVVTAEGGKHHTAARIHIISQTVAKSITRAVIRPYENRIILLQRCQGWGKTTPLVFDKGRIGEVETRVARHDVRKSAGYVEIIAEKQHFNLSRHCGPVVCPYKDGHNQQRINPTTPLSLALCLPALTMREIRLVIAPLDPGHEGEALLNRIRMQG